MLELRHRGPTCWNWYSGENVKHQIEICQTSYFEFPKSFHFENLPRNYFKKMWNFTQHNKFFHDEDKASKKPKSPFTRKIFAVYPNYLSTQTRKTHLRCGALGSKNSKMKEGYYQIIFLVFNGNSISKRSQATQNKQIRKGLVELLLWKIQSTQKIKK